MTNTELPKYLSLDIMKGLKGEITSLISEGYQRKEVEDRSSIYAEASELCEKEYGIENLYSACINLIYAESLIDTAIKNTTVFGTDNQNGEDDECADLSDSDEEHNFAIVKQTQCSSSKTNNKNLNNCEDKGEAEIYDDDFVLAWHVLENSKAVLLENLEHENKDDIHQLLSKVHFLLEKFELALEDYFEALKYSELSNGKYNRFISEIHFKISLVYEYSIRLEEAVKHLKIVEDILVKLRDSEDENKEELDILYEEVQMKVNDLSEPDKAKEILKSLLTQSNTPVFKDVDSSKTVDVSNLVKRKRDPTENVEPNKK